MVPIDRDICLCLINNAGLLDYFFMFRTNPMVRLQSWAEATPLSGEMMRIHPDIFQMSFEWSYGLTMPLGCFFFLAQQDNSSSNMLQWAISLGQNGLTHTKTALEMTLSLARPVTLTYLNNSYLSTDVKCLNDVMLNDGNGDWVLNLSTFA